jgi:hypothetical protein
MIREGQGAKIFECFPAEAPILLADFTLKPISEISVGDEVVGFEKGKGRRSKLVKATVNLLERMTKPVVRITLSNGNIIRCTLDHPWYTGRLDGTHKLYKPASVGSSLLQVYDISKVPSFEELLDYRYLAGLLDGEGACKHGSIAIGQSKAANPEVYAGIGGVLTRLHIPYKVCKVNPNDTHILRNKEIRRGLGESFVLGGGREIKADILRFGNPAKRDAILNTIWNKPHNPSKDRVKVLSIEDDGIETVYAIGTTSGNYVAYGYATKNTQYLNRPRAGEDVTFDVSYLVEHDTLAEFPSDGQYYTVVDLAGWGDKKRQARNAIVTGKKDEHNHLWIARVDAGRLNPSQVIEIFEAHQKQFDSKVLIEEIQYQRAIRHFANLRMQEGKVEWYNIGQLPYDGRKDAKNLRIRSLEPIVKNGGLHVLKSMKMLRQELEDYPYSATVDILDCVGYLRRYSMANRVQAPTPKKDPFVIEELEHELKLRARPDFSIISPFELNPDVVTYRGAWN